MLDLTPRVLKGVSDNKQSVPPQTPQTPQTQKELPVVKELPNKVTEEETHIYKKVDSKKYRLFEVNKVCSNYLYFLKDVLKLPNALQGKYCNSMYKDYITIQESIDTMYTNFLISKKYGSIEINISIPVDMEGTNEILVEDKLYITNNTIIIKENSINIVQFIIQYFNDFKYLKDYQYKVLDITGTLYDLDDFYKREFSNIIIKELKNDSLACANCYFLSICTKI